MLMSSDRKRTGSIHDVPVDPNATTLEATIEPDREPQDRPTPTRLQDLLEGGDDEAQQMEVAPQLARRSSPRAQHSPDVRGAPDREDGSGSRSRPKAPARPERPPGGAKGRLTAGVAIAIVILLGIAILVAVVMSKR
jgi:hypothetical protein